MYTLISFTLLGLSSVASSHMIMKTPTPFAASKLAGDNGPLHADGSNFPCKFGYDTEGASNVMPLGSKQQLAFVGGATHGGGSCQVSLTYDSAPTASSKFKVIHSIIGGCPARNTAGNIGASASAEDPDKYEFSIPNDLPPGDAVLAWTWFNKVGNREMYMNCAPVKLTAGGATKRETKNETLIARGMEAFDALPDMFVANIGNGCTTKDGTDLKFDNPGKSVDMISTTSLAGPVGNCAASGAGASSSGAGAGTSAGASGAGAGGSGAGASGSGVGASGAGAGASGSGASGTGAGAGAGAGASGGSGSPAGGAFFTVSSSATSKPTATSDQSATAAKQPEATAASATTSASTSGTTPASTSGGSSSAAGGASPAAGASQKTAGAPCTTEGAWNCMGESYQRCASGTWSAIMPLAAGTSCNAGTAERIVIEAKTRRVRRAPRAHLRRHMNKMRFL